MNKWPLQSECSSKFGNPYSKGWGAQHIVHVKCPYQLMMGSIKVPYIKINAIAAPSLARIIDFVWNDCDKDLDKIKAYHADQFSGDWVIRQARGLKMISMHSYGLAVDFDAPHNQLGSKKYFFNKKNPLVAAFLEEGWTWGATWSRPDAMHFQAARVK